MPISLVLIFGLTVATCIIAYWSDNLGKKLGKKRISLFGVRPRLTATIISMVSSVGITWFTLAVMLIVFPLLRDALLRYERVNRQNQTLLKQNDSLVQVKSGLLQQVGSSKRQADAARREAQTADQKAAETRTRVGRLNQQFHTAQTQLTSARASASLARTREVSATQAARAIQLRLGDEQRSLRQVRLDLAHSRAGLISVRQQLQLAKVELTNAVKKSTIALHSTTQAIRDNARLQLEVASREATVAQLNKRAEDQQRKVAELTAAQGDLEISIAKLAAVSSRDFSLGEIAAGHVMIPVNTVLAARQPPVPISASAARALLDSMLKGATEAVQDCCSKLGAKRVKLLRLPLDLDKQTFLDEEQILTLMTGHLTSSSVPLSVRLVTTRSHAEGEENIMCRFETVPIRKAFTQGEMLAETTIDGQESDVNIFNQLLKLLEQGQDAATRQHGVMPVLNSAEPNIYAAGTNERIFEALRRLQSLHSNARVRVTAASDLTNVQPLQVRIEVQAL